MDRMGVTEGIQTIFRNLNKCTIGVVDIVENLNDSTKTKKHSKIRQFDLKQKETFSNMKA